MKYAVRLAFFVLLSGLALSACTRNTNTSNANPSPRVPASLADSPESPASSPNASPTLSPTVLTQTYREPEGAFQISLPRGYQYERTETGIIFNSPDGSFRGEVVFGSAQGETYTNDQLEAFLKEAYRANLNLAEVEWQQTAVQPDGSLRIDWIGKDAQDTVLDAESFIEQRGDTIFILTLSGINEPYIDYINDAQAIVSSYRVRQQ